MLDDGEDVVAGPLDAAGRDGGLGVVLGVVEGIKEYYFQPIDGATCVFLLYLDLTRCAISSPMSHV